MTSIHGGLLLLAKNCSSSFHVDVSFSPHAIPTRWVLFHENKTENIAQSHIAREEVKCL